MSATQQSLFGTAAARRGDNEASHTAAVEIESSGKAGSDRAKCLQAVERHPGLTTRELHNATGLPVHMLGRRLFELASQGDIRRENTPGGWRCWVT